MKSFGIGLLILPLLFINGCQDNHSYQGYVETENIYLASPYSGVLKKMCVQRGDSVKKGQLLFQLDEYPQAFLLDQAKAFMMQQTHSLEDAKQPKRPQEIAALEWGVTQVDAQIRLAQLRVKRNEELYQKRVLDKDSLDASKERYEELVALKKQQEENIELAKLGARKQQIMALTQVVNSAKNRTEEVQWQLKQKKLYAPEDGFVFDTYYREGEFVSAEKPVASILTLNKVYIQFFVPVKTLAKLKIGQKITFTADGIPQLQHAEIRYISPEAEYIPPLVYSRENNDKLVFRIKATPANPMAFKPGQPVVVMGF